MKTITALFFVVLLFGCTSTKKIDEAFNKTIGLHKSDLIMRFGPPDRYEPDGKGGEILVYEVSSKSAYSYGNAVTVRENTKYTMYYADTTGKVYHWKRNW